MPCNQSTPLSYLVPSSPGKQTPARVYLWRVHIPSLSIPCLLTASLRYLFCDGGVLPSLYGSISLAQGWRSYTNSNSSSILLRLKCPRDHGCHLSISIPLLPCFLCLCPCRSIVASFSWPYRPLLLSHLKQALLLFKVQLSPTGHVPVWQRVFNIYKGCFYMCTWTHCPRTLKLRLVGVARPLKSEWWGSSRSLSFTSPLVVGSFLLLYNSVSSSVNCCWRLWLLFLLQGRHCGNEFESAYTWICYLPSELYTRWVLNNKQWGGKEHIVGKWGENPWFRCWVLPSMLSSHRALKVPGWVGNPSNFSAMEILLTWALDCLGYTYLCNHDKVSIFMR